MKEKLFIYITIFALLMFSIISHGNQQVVVTLGNDLNQQQRQEILELFRVVEEDTRILLITNEEERKYLEGVASEKEIGNHAISSAFVKSLAPGEKMTIEIYNINWLTRDMVANALTTAGITNAKVIIAAPFEVSGTAALTGIIKAFEELRGKALGEGEKRAANKEIVKTGELGQDIGREKAATLIREIKYILVKEGVKEPEEIRKIVINVANELNISLSDKQLQDILNLMEEISRLKIDRQLIQGQLKDIGKSLNEISSGNKEIKSLLERIIDMIGNFLKTILGMLSKG